MKWTKKKSLAPAETFCLNIEHMLNFLIWCSFLFCKSPLLTLKSDTSLSAPFSQGCDFFGTLPYNQIDLQKYFFDASPGSAKITCENIVHTIHIRKYTLVPTLGCLKVDLSFEEKKKRKTSSQVSKEWQTRKLLLDASSFTKVSQQVGVCTPLHYGATAFMINKHALTRFIKQWILFTKQTLRSLDK